MGDCIYCGEKGVDHRHYAGCKELAGKTEEHDRGNTDGHGCAPSGAKAMDGKRTDADGVEKKVLEFVAEGCTNEPTISLDMRLDYLGYDSLDKSTIAVEMEETYGIEISEEAVSEWVIVRDIVATVCGLRGAVCEKEPDKEKGLYAKYYVKRLNDDAGKHKNCEFFVLDWQHDKFAIPAMAAYANACENEYPQLTRDIRAKIKQYESEQSDLSEPEGTDYLG